MYSAIGVLSYALAQVMPLGVSITTKKFYEIGTCGLYYKSVTIVIDAPSVVSKWRSKL
jgi:hypothetical protein